MLTAKMLDQQVAPANAYHVLRNFIILPLMPLVLATGDPPEKRSARTFRGRKVSGPGGSTTSILRSKAKVPIA